MYVVMILDIDDCETCRFYASKSQIGILDMDVYGWFVLLTTGRVRGGEEGQGRGAW